MGSDYGWNYRLIGGFVPSLRDFCSSILVLPRTYVLGYYLPHLRG
jgi:hypothetical protein